MGSLQGVVERITGHNLKGVVRELHTSTGTCIFRHNTGTGTVLWDGHSERITY